MTEKLNPAHEKSSEKLDLEAESKHNLDRLQRGASQEKIPKKSLENLRHEIARQAVSGKELDISEQRESSQTPIGVQRELKNTAYKRSLNRVQSGLGSAERLLSQVIHQPAIERISNVGAQTVARPSGIMGGGVAALLGSSTLLFVSKRYGFEYNYFMFVLLFIGGFAAGLLIEGLVKLAARKR